MCKYFNHKHKTCHRGETCRFRHVYPMTATVPMAWETIDQIYVSCETTITEATWQESLRFDKMRAATSKRPALMDCPRQAPEVIVIGDNPDGPLANKQENLVFLGPKVPDVLFQGPVDVH